MRFWKLISLTLFLFTAVVVVATNSSCEKNSCSGVTCYNGGSCGSGLCRCPTGYEGAQCQSLMTTRYLGTYGGYISCNNGAYVIDTAVITRGNRGILSVDVHLQSIAPKILEGYVSSNVSTYSIIITNNDSSKIGSINYLKVHTITLQDDKNLSIHTYEHNYTNSDDTVVSQCSFLGYKN